MQDSSVTKRFANWILVRPVLIRGIAFLLILLISLYVLYQYYEGQRGRFYKGAHEVSEITKRDVQQSLDQCFSAALTASFAIGPQGQVSEFDSIASSIIQLNRRINAVELMPEGIIRYIYPDTENHPIRGYNIFKDSIRNKKAIRAKETGRMYFGGPFELREGGQAIVGFRPVYRQNKFWGFTAVLIRLDVLLNMAGIGKEDSHGYFSQLSRVNSKTRKEKFFSPFTGEGSGEAIISTTVPETDWIISVYSRTTFGFFNRFWGWLVFILFLSGFGSYLVSKILKRPTELQKIVDQRTRQLELSEKRNKAIVNAIPDLIFILDSEGRFLDFHNSLPETLLLPPEKFLGQKVTSVMPGRLGATILENIRRAISEKTIINHTYELEVREEMKNFEARYVASDSTEVYVIIRDITSTQKMLGALKESEERFRSIFNSSYQFTGLLSPEGKVLEVNKTLLDYLNITEAEVVGKYMWDINFWQNEKEVPERVEWLKRAIQKAGNGDMVRREINAWVKDGVIDTVDFSLKPMKDQHGRIIYLIPEARITTDIRKAEAELNLANKHLAEHLNNSPLAILEYTNALQITQWSKKAEQLFGWTKQEAVGNNLVSLNLVYKEDVAAATAIIMQLLSGNVNGNISYNRNSTKRGKVLDCVWYNSVIRDEKGNIISILSQVQDLTHERETEKALRQSEQKYRTLIDQASDAIIVYNPEGRVIEFNESALKYTGYQKEEIGHTVITDFLFAEEIKEKPLRFDELKMGKAVTDQRKIKRKDGSGFYVELNSKILPNGNIMAIARDITERKTAEEKLFASEKKLRQVLSSMADNFYVVDRNYTIILINEIAERNLEIAWGKKIRVGYSVLELIPTETQEPVKESFDRVFTGETVEYELSSDNEKLPSWVLVSFAPVFDESGMVTGASVIAKDISERKIAELSLLENKERLEKAEAMANLGSWEFDLVSGQGHWSRQMLRMFGYPASAPAPSPQEYLELIHPDDRPVISGVMDDLVTGKEPVITVFRTNPEKLPLRYFIPSLNCIRDVQGKAIKFEGTILDITGRIKAENEIRLSQRKLAESEGRLKSIIEQAPDAVYLADMDGQIVMVNPVAVEQLGYTEEEFLAMNVTVLDLDFSDKKKLAGYWENLDLNMPAMLETWHRKKNGDRIPVEIKTSRISIAGKDHMIGFVRDITIRKEAESKLINSELRFRTLTENAPVGIFQTDREGKTIYVNDAFLSYLGMPLEKVLGYGWSMAIHPDDRKYLLHDWETRVSVHHESTAEYRMYNNNGDIIWVSGRAIPLFDNQGNYNGYLGTIIDITYRKKAEEEIIKIKERYELIALATNDALWETDYITGETWWNYRHYQFYGHDPDLPALPNHEWEIRIHPDQREYIITSFNKSIEKRGTIWEEEYLFRMPSGKYAYVNDKAFFYYQDDRLQKIIGSMTDITEKRASEEKLKESEIKYRHLFTSSPLPMWVCETESCRFMDVNEAAINHYGYSRNEFLQMSFWDLLPAKGSISKTDFDAGIRQRAKFKGIFQQQKKEGILIDVEISAHEINFNNNPGRLMVAVDITDKLAYEKEIKRTSQRLRELTDHLHTVREEERKHIAREIHDELGQQLTVLKMDVSSLLKKAYPSEAEREQKIKGLLKLVDETVKTVRKISSELRPSMLDDLGLIAALEWHSQEFENRSGIKIHFISDVAEIKLSSKLMNGLYRIYQEALTNIARHADATEIKSIVRLKNNAIELIVKDNGKGFELSAVENKKTLGILGMQERVAMLEGNFNIYSSQGEGTLVEVVIPVGDILD